MAAALRPLTHRLITRETHLLPGLPTSITHRTFHTTPSHLISIKSRMKQIPLDPNERGGGRTERKSRDTVDVSTSTALKRKLLSKISTRQNKHAGTGTNTDTMRWLYGAGLAYYDFMEKPRNYLKPDMPYPMNPLYKPVSPISNVSRNKIFLDHNEDPVKHSPRKLAEKYGISIVRVEAIIRSKNVELEMLQRGEIVEQNFAKSMDFVLAAMDAPGTEKDIELIPQVSCSIPFYAVAEEDKEFGPKEAGDALGRPSLDVVKEVKYGKVDRDAAELVNSVKIRSGDIRIISHDEMLAVAPVVSGADPALKNSRHQYQFVDLSSKDGVYARRSLIRDRTGLLREATPLERANHATVRRAKMDVYIGNAKDRFSKRERVLKVGSNGITYRKAIPLKRRA